MRKLNLTLLAAFALSVPSFAFFEVGNAPDFETSNGYWSDSIASGGAYYYNQSMAESFTLEGAPSFNVQTVTWWGFSEFFIDPDLSNMSSFEVNIYEQDGDVPGANLYNSTFDLANLTVTSVYEIEPGYSIYELTAAVSTSLAAGDYFFNVGANLVDGQGDAFAWLTAPVGEDDATFAFTRGATWETWTSTQADDLAFQIDGEAVPEPMTMTVLGGLALLAARRRKKA